MSWVYLIVILTISIASQTQRFLLAFAFGFKGETGTVQEDNATYEISTAYPQLVPMIGVVSGAMFALPLSITGIFVGVMVISVNRKWMLCIGCIVWSLFTFLQGYIDSFPVFCILRSLMGIAMSVCNPLAYSLIRDYFPPSKRATANSLYSSAIYVGNALASLNIIYIKEYGWRYGYMTVGLFGVALAFLGILVI